MKLFFKAGSCSLIPLIVAHEANVPVEMIRITFTNQEDGKILGTLPDGSDFKKINAKNYVPYFVTNDNLPLSEVPAIASFIANENPQSTIAPQIGSFEYFKMLEWLSYISTEIHKKSFMPIFLKIFGANIPDVTANLAKQSLKDCFEYVEQQLEGKKFLVNNHFTCADAALYVVMLWADRIEVDYHKKPNLSHFFDLVKARPAVIKAHQTEQN